MTFEVMNKVMNNLRNLCNSTVIQLVNENVIRFPNQNTHRTRVKQIRNPQKEISGGFFIFVLIFYELFSSNYNVCLKNELQ